MDRKCDFCGKTSNDFKIVTVERLTDHKSKEIRICTECAKKSDIFLGRQKNE